MSEHGPRTKSADIVAYWSAQWNVAIPEDKCWGCWQELPLSRAHIISRYEGGPDQPDNLMMMCRNCNFMLDATTLKHGREAGVMWAKDVVVRQSPAVPKPFMDLAWKIYAEDPDAPNVPPMLLGEIANNAHVLRALMREPFGGRNREKKPKGMCSCGKPVHSAGKCNTCYIRERRRAKA